MSQNDRIAKRLLAHGAINTTDFLAPNVCDGGKPIIRLAARILELREDGWAIDRLVESNGTATYLLGVEREADGSQDAVSVPLSTLFEHPPTVAGATGGWD